MQVLVVVLFCQKMTSGAFGDTVVKEDQDIEISCTLSESRPTIVWFRILDTLGIEFIATFGFTGDLKTTSLKPPFRPSSKKHHILLKSFKKARDSGVYGCASQKNQEMLFGKVTRLVGEKVEVRTEAPPKTTKPLPCTTSAPCNCQSEAEKDSTSSLLLCSPLVFGPLVGGCGLLLLLLIVTTLYCNKIRTRRCPHHHKRKPRPVPPGKQMMTNRHM